MKNSAGYGKHKSVRLMEQVKNPVLWEQKDLKKDSIFAQPSVLYSVLLQIYPCTIENVIN